jgi:adenylate kinase
LLCETLGACHLSTGDLLRAAKCQLEPTPALREAQETMRRGELVPDAVIVALVRERTGCLHCHGGFLLDGFPRTVTQAEALDQLMAEQGLDLDFVLQYEMPLEEVVARLSGRRVCSGCQAVYHVITSPTKVEGACDQCGKQLVQRDDDRPEAVRVRIGAYEDTAAPLAEYYKSSGRLLSIQASGIPKEILQRTLHALEQRTRAQKELR